MKKNKALGHDPLAWIKATKEVESKQADEAPKAGETETPTIEIPPPEINKEEKESPSLEITPPEIKKPEAKETVVEGSKEGPTLEIPKPVQKESEPRQERIHFIPEPGPVTTKELPIPSRKESQWSSLIFIIAYAALLLILTFFVYFSLSGKIDYLNSRISTLEKALTAKYKEEGIRR